MELTAPEWDRAIQSSPYCSYFHQSCWIKTVCEHIGGTYRLVVSDGWAYPLFFGEPWSETFRIGSIGYGGPLPLFAIKSPELPSLQPLVDLYQMPCSGLTAFPHSGWKEANSETEILALQDPETLFKKVLSGNVRTAIRRATGCLAQQLEEREEAYSLLVQTQERVEAGYITQKPFFMALCDLPGVELWGGFSESGALATMALLLIGEREAFHLFHGWNPEEQVIGLNQLLIWNMIQSAEKAACKTFNLGESHSPSLKKAKQRWGSHSFGIVRN